MCLEKKIKACFGDSDVKFAHHKADEERAKLLIKEEKNKETSFEEFEKEIVYFCYQRVKAEGYLENHIKEQISKLKKMWKL